MTLRPTTPPIPRLSPAQLRGLRSRLRLSIRDASLTDLSPSARDHSGPHSFWELEPQPFLLPASDWALLHPALHQRARLVNAFLSDVYSRQEVLHQKILPPEVVLADPYYRRPCLGLESHRTSPATLLRFDLVHTPRGWCFTRTLSNTPVGLSFAVQNRRLMTQEADDLYRALPDYHSVINFPLQLLQALRALAPPGKLAPSIIVLSAGPHDPFFSEHSFLARKMGLPLARGDDLLVLDNQVYFKTIAGLERVDVIYRRLNDTHIDPVVFSTDRETAGIPGLLQCIRTGNVVVANAIGSGIAESRALDAYLPQLMRFYLRERPRLPSLPTFTCADPDQLDQVLDHSTGGYSLLPIHDLRSGEQPRLTLATLPSGQRVLPREVRHNPHRYVAQARPEALNLVPLGRHSPPSTFSAFVLCSGDRIDVFPGGIVQIGHASPPVARMGLTADTLVLLGSASTGEVADFEPGTSSTARLHTLGSRAAEHLFWLGRYLERAVATGRMLTIFDDVALEEIPARDRRRWLPLWRGLLEATGHGDQKIPVRGNPQTTLNTDLTRHMALDLANPGSIHSSVAWACENARQLRDHVSPECWKILSRLRSRLESLARPPSSGRSPSPSAPDLALAEVVNEINAFMGTAENTMLHDAGWHFLRMGLHLERAVMTCSSLRPALAAHDLGPANLHADAGLAFRDNPELSALLRMLGSQDVYRRLYQTRSQPRHVARLFLQQPDAPHGIFNLLHQIKTSLRAIKADLAEPGADSLPLLTVEDHLRFLASLQLDRHFTPDLPQPAIGELLASLLERLHGLHPVLSDHYFSHQARLAEPLVQTEMPL